MSFELVQSFFNHKNFQFSICTDELISYQVENIIIFFNVLTKNIFYFDQNIDSIQCYQFYNNKLIISVITSTQESLLKFYKLNTLTNTFDYESEYDLNGLIINQLKLSLDTTMLIGINTIYEYKLKIWYISLHNINEVLQIKLNEKIEQILINPYNKLQILLIYNIEKKKKKILKFYNYINLIIILFHYYIIYLC